MTHAVVGVGLGKLYTARKMPVIFWELAAGLAVLPDVDVYTFQLRIPYQSPWGHRGFTHSLLFALIVSFGITLLTFRRLAPLKWWSLWAFFFLVTASHGILDAFTDGGYGVGFFVPLTDTRYFFPWHPIRVPHFGVQMFLTREGLERFASELLWVWLPTIVLVGAVMLYRRWAAPQPAPEPAPPRTDG
jgi:inner membrane protein